MLKKIFAILTSVAMLTEAQVEAHKPGPAAEGPEFFVEALSFSSSDSLQSRVDLYIQVTYEALQFVKTDASFVGRYEVTTNFLTEENALLSEKVWTEDVRVQQFEMTRSKSAYNLSQRSVSLPPGRYILRAQVRDLESKKISTIARKVTVGSYADSLLMVSDIMLVSRATTDGERQRITPNVTGNIAENNNRFFTFIEIYSPNPDDSLQVRYGVSDSQGKEISSKMVYQKTSGDRTPVITGFDSVDYSSGSYVLTVEVRSLKGIGIATKQRGFFVRWGNLPLAVMDMDMAIKQVRYIAKENEYSLFEEAKSDDEKRKLFDAFWKKRDPNPATQRNEVMEEYYGRVEYANEHFSHYIPGWRTDMGMVFIIFGSPNNVERHPFDIDSKPYEIWSYYDYNRSVIFVDETGFGDYRLITPIWDLIQRLKY